MVIGARAQFIWCVHGGCARLDDGEARAYKMASYLRMPVYLHDFRVVYTGAIFATSTAAGNYDSFVLKRFRVFGNPAHFFAWPLHMYVCLSNAFS